MSSFYKILLIATIVVCKTIVANGQLIIEDGCYDPEQVCDDCVIPMVERPVCGCDGKKYMNPTAAKTSGIVRWESMDIDLVYDSHVCGEQAVEISVTGSYYTYSWSNGGDSKSTEVYADETASYSVLVTTNYGCSTELTATIVVDGPKKVKIDTIITLGDSVKVGDSYYTLPGTFSKTITSDEVCDSIFDITIQLEEFDNCMTIINDTIFDHYTQNVTVYDTIKTTFNDTAFYTISDTIVKTEIDTAHTFDTLYVFSHDTIRHEILDTVITTVVDTIYFNLSDNPSKVGTDDYFEILTLTPNPVSHTLVVGLGKTVAARYFIADLQGIVKKEAEVNSSKFTVSVEDIPAGIYILNIATAEQKIISKKIAIK